MHFLRHPKSLLALPRDRDSLRERLLRQAILCAAFMVAYLVLTKSGVILEQKLGTVVWYPALGLGFALMVGLSPAYAPLLIVTDVFCSAINYHQPLTSWASLVGTPINTLIYAFAARILLGPLHFDCALKRRRDISLYGLVALGAAVPCGFVGATCLVADGSVSLANFRAAALRWCLGDAVSLLGATPFLLIHVFPHVRRKLSRADTLGVLGTSSWQMVTTAAKLLETAGQTASIFLVLWIIFRSPFSQFQPYYLVLMPVIWIGLRHGISRATTGILAVNLGMALCQRAYAQDLQNPARLTLLMLVVSFTGLIVGSAVSEHYLADQRLREQTTYLNLLITYSPFGIVVVDPDLRISLCNRAFAKLFASNKQELQGKGLDSLALSHSETEQLNDVARQVFAGRAVHRIIQHEAPDARISHLELHAVPLEQDGRVRQAYAIYKDITEQVKAESAAREHAESLKRGIEELQLRTEQMSLMNQMADFLQCCADSQEAYSVFKRFAPMLFNDALSGMLFAVHSDQKFVDVIVSWGASHLSEPVFDLESCWALRRGAPHWSHSAEPITCAHMPGHTSSWFLCLPMVAQGETTGVLHLQYEAVWFQSADPEAARASRQRLASNVAGQLAASLASLSLRERLRDQSLKDPLTGLFNRRAVQDTLERELHRARRRMHELSLLLIDLDHFKNFNDSFGHDAGDLVLKTMSKLFLSHFRAEDLVCRFGGEEFAVLLPEASLEDAGKRAEKLCSEAGKLVIHYNGQALKTVTLSIGIAGYPEHGNSASELVRAADDALYRSKADGRNRVTVASHQTSHA